MSSYDDHASCPQCRIAAGECYLDAEYHCSICGGWMSKQWNKLRRSFVDARARASQRGRHHWTSAFSKLEAWILSRPALSTTSSGPASEISSLVSGDDFSDRLLVGTPSYAVSSAGLCGTSSKWGQYGIWYGHYGTQYCHYGTQYGTQYGTPAVNDRAKHIRTYFSYCCAITGSGHAQCYSKCQASCYY